MKNSANAHIAVHQHRLKKAPREFGVPFNRKSEEYDYMKNAWLMRHPFKKNYALMILALAAPIVVGLYALMIGSWVYAAAFGLVAIVNFDLFHHSNKKVMPYTFRLLVKWESKIYKEPYDARLEE
jgi:hypothetical protein